MAKVIFFLSVFCLLAEAESRLLSKALPLTVKDYTGEYYMNGNKDWGGILVTEAKKTKGGAQYNAPDDDLKDFPGVATQADLKDALWVWLKGENGRNGEGWYHHDTIYKVKLESATKMTAMTGDMQREEGGQPKSGQYKSALKITLDSSKNALVMNIGDGEEVWVNPLSGSQNS
mmetsp:Transcript_86636/g.158194  ORF Transcript_86636/g.158194 Transcript_86636/m.158194 type:complete len:174 (+) Transcript_86636:80-601(+)